MRRILEWAKTGIAVVAVTASLGLEARGLRTVARWVGVALLTRVLPGHVTGWVGETVYWIIGAGLALGLTGFILNRFQERRMLRMSEVLEMRQIGRASCRERV